MKKLFSVARYTFIENVRKKIFYVVVIFGMVLIGASLLLAALGGEQYTRVLLDIGLGTVELFALIMVCFGSVTLILEEMESKTIYLVLSRPISRMAYLGGRFAGLLAAVYCGMIAMALIHMAILFIGGWDFSPRYILALGLSAEKITIIGSLALFFSLFSTSMVSSIVFTLLFWVLGHFSEEIRFLGTKATGIVAVVFSKAVYYLIPNLQYFNLRDFWDVPQVVGGWVMISFAYGALYSLFFLGASLWLFKYKEF